MKKTITLSLALMLTFAIMAQVSPKANKSLSQQKLVQLHANKHDAKGWFGTAQTTLKSVTSDKHVLDSALWWELNTDNNQYELDWKDVFVYNENGQVILFKYYTGNANLHLFAYDSIYYNANSQISERVSYYDETESGQTPVKYGRALYTYNENNLVIQESYFNWDSESNLWVESWRAEFEYNANGQIETELEYEYNEEAGELQLYMQIKETYNAQSLLSQSIRSYWNADQSSWENAEKSTCEYNASNKLILEQEFYWDSENSLWLNSFKEEYSYDGNGHMTQEIDYDWVEESSAFVPSYKDVYEFDANNNLMNIISYNWNNEASNWVEEYKDSFTYDNTVSFEQLTLPWAVELESEEEMRLYFNHKLIGGVSYEWDAQNNNWTENEKSAYYYTAPGGGTNITNDYIKQLTLYPNPANNSITFSSAGLVKIYDNTGRLLLTQFATTNQAIDINALSGGIYIAEISNYSTRTTIKFVKN